MVDPNMPTNDETRRALMLTMGQFLAANRDQFDGEPYPDGADLSHVVDQATWVMSGFTGLVAAAGAPKVRYDH